MEIKTCEHYVINRVMELENTVESQRNRISELVCKTVALEEKLEYVASFLSIKKAYDWNATNNSTYIEFNSVWKKHDPTDYTKLCEMFGLTESDEEEE